MQIKFFRKIFGSQSGCDSYRANENLNKIFVTCTCTLSFLRHKGYFSFFYPTYCSPRFLFSVSPLLVRSGDASFTLKVKRWTKYWNILVATSNEWDISVIPMLGLNIWTLVVSFWLLPELRFLLPIWLSIQEREIFYPLQPRHCHRFPRIHM